MFCSNLQYKWLPLKNSFAPRGSFRVAIIKALLTSIEAINTKYSNEGRSETDMTYGMFGEIHINIAKGSKPIRNNGSK